MYVVLIFSYMKNTVLRDADIDRAYISQAVEN